MIIQDTENPEKYIREQLGGKGLNLLKLAKFSREINLFRVPKFFILDTDTNGFHCFPPEKDEYLDFKDKVEVQSAFSKLNKPVIVRSSAPSEDGELASFAGMFLSLPNILNYDEFSSACAKVKNSSLTDRVSKYAQRMGINFDERMALIVQEQVVNPMLKGTVQIEDYGVSMEYFEDNSDPEVMERDLDFLDKHCPFREMRPLNYIGEGHYYMVMNLARDAKKALGLEGIVQVEFCLDPKIKPDFVQIRKLPNKLSIIENFDLNIPEGVPRLESNVCNGIAGELVLPAYVTVSAHGIQRILVETGQGSNLEGDTRSEEFEAQTKLANNQDFITIRYFKAGQFSDRDKFFRECNKTWERGNSLFPEYMMICDRLDQSCDGMNDLTTNKKAIITCGEASKSSHAMTVARDLGIMCMGVMGDFYDLNNFLYQVETGDLIHMKSDGKRAVAYVEKRREKDPYAISE